MSPSNAVRIRRRVRAAATAALAALVFAGPVQAETPLLLPAPADVRVEPGSPTRAESITVRWTAPADLPDGTTTHWALCNDADIAPIPGQPNGCGGANAGTASGSSVTIPTPDEIAGTVWVWYEDGADRKGPATRAPVVIDRTAPASPKGVRWTNGAVSWAPVVDGGAPVVRAHWRLCRSWDGFASDCIEGAADGSSSFAFAETPLPPTPRPRECIGFTALLLVWLEDAAGNVDRRRLGGTGIGATPGCTPPAPPKVDPPAPQATALALSHRVRTVGKGGKRRQRVTVTATTTPSGLTGPVRIRVTGKQGKRTLTRTRTVTLSKGRARYTLTVPKGFRRLSVTATYAGSATHAPSSRTAAVRIPRR